MFSSITHIANLVQLFALQCICSSIVISHEKANMSVNTTTLVNTTNPVNTDNLLITTTQSPEKKANSFVLMHSSNQMYLALPKIRCSSIYRDAADFYPLPIRPSLKAANTTSTHNSYVLGKRPSADIALLRGMSRSLSRQVNDVAVCVHDLCL